ncbi:hypothetical protein PGTUg99_031664 [Puccinia graminis f. sp. tritici]|uniref:Uncharacterized protein n=1 Tax=Puccinia graminis f. sp. tritici TaxID=56615 RepID=A0A5B0RLD5_PUCGR|nr:hypothetical protein PGTUg99_031664 [Puccinia graminis f. sp. tritici]
MNQPASSTTTNETSHLLNQQATRDQNQNNQRPTSVRFFIPTQPHSTITNFILNYSHSQEGLLSSVALNENDLSVDPVGLDLDLHHSALNPNQLPLPSLNPLFKKSRFLMTLDIFKAIILSIRIESAIDVPNNSPNARPRYVSVITNPADKLKLEIHDSALKIYDCANKKKHKT